MGVPQDGCRARPAPLARCARVTSASAGEVLSPRGVSDRSREPWPGLPLDRWWNVARSPGNRVGDECPSTAAERRRRRPASTSPVATVPTSSSLSAEARSTNARARRTRPPGARDERCAPTQTPGMQPRSSDVVRSSWKSPNRMWPSAADATSGTACTRSVPTSSLGLERRVERHQRDDDQRAGADRGHADHEPADRADEHGRQRSAGATVGRPCGSGVGRPSRRRARSTQPQVGADDQARGGEQQRDARGRAGSTSWTSAPSPERAGDQHAAERGRHRPDAQPLRPGRG